MGDLAKPRKGEELVFKKLLQKDLPFLQVL